jgi:hypothetical protein
MRYTVGAEEKMPKTDFVGIWESMNEILLMDSTRHHDITGSIYLCKRRTVDFKIFILIPILIHLVD